MKSESLDDVECFGRSGHLLLWLYVASVGTVIFFGGATIYIFAVNGGALPLMIAIVLILSDLFLIWFIYNAVQSMGIIRDTVMAGCVRGSDVELVLYDQKMIKLSMPLAVEKCKVPAKVVKSKLFPSEDCLVIRTAERDVWISPVMPGYDRLSEILLDN